MRSVDEGQQLMDIGNRLRRRIAHSTIKAQENRLSVTVSMGAAMASRSDNVDQMVKRADPLIYESKDKGRNQVTLG